jgi:hypothetical protein
MRKPEIQKFKKDDEVQVIRIIQNDRDKDSDEEIAARFYLHSVGMVVDVARVNKFMSYLYTVRFKPNVDWPPKMDLEFVFTANELELVKDEWVCCDSDDGEIFIIAPEDKTKEWYWEKAKTHEDGMGGYQVLPLQKFRGDFEDSWEKIDTYKNKKFLKVDDFEEELDQQIEEKLTMARLEGYEKARDILRVGFKKIFAEVHELLSDAGFEDEDIDNILK